MAKMEETRKCFVFYSFNAIGHVHPILSIAASLLRRGHRVVILTIKPLTINLTDLKAMGLEVEYCHETADHDEANDRLTLVMKPLCDLFRRGIKEAMRATYSNSGAVGRHLDEVIDNHDLIKSKLESFKPDLIIVDHIHVVPCATTVAPKWVRLYSGFPSVLFSSYNEGYVAGMGLKMSEMSKEWKEFESEVKSESIARIEKFCKDTGIAHWGSKIDLSPTSPYLNFCLGPDELALDNEKALKPLPNVWTRLEHTIDESLFKDRKDFEVPECLQNLSGKLIYFSLGTLVSCDVQLIKRLLEALSKSPNKFIISMGQLHEHINLYPNMWGEKFIDQKAVLKKVDLFITHAGHNSIIEAFYYGVPGLVLLPVFADQFDLAQRVDDCGFGIRLDPYHCTQEELLGAIDSLLARDSLRQQMSAISSRLKSIKYNELAADKLCQLASLGGDADH